MDDRFDPMRSRFPGEPAPSWADPGRSVIGESGTETSDDAVSRSEYAEVVAELQRHQEYCRNPRRLDAVIEAFRAVTTRCRELESTINQGPAVVALFRAFDLWPVVHISENIRQFGYAREDFARRDTGFFALIHEDDRERIRQEVAGYADRKRFRFDMEFRIRTREGGIRWVHDRTFLRRNEKGDVTHYHAIIRDITEEREARGALEENEDFYRGILDAIATGVWVSDEYDVIRYANRGMREIAGLDIEECNILLDFPGEVMANVRSLYQEVRDTLEPQRYREVPVETPAGRKSWQSGWLIPRVRGGVFRGIICTVEDVSEEKFAHDELTGHRENLEQLVATRTAEFESANTRLRAEIENRLETEKALRASEELFRQSLENSPNPIFSVDVNGRIRTWNRACRDIFQYDSAIIGESFHIVVAEKAGNSQLDRMIADVFDKREFEAEDLSFRCRDGSIRYTISRLYPLLGPDDNVLECVLTNTDITDRKRMEEALKESQRKLNSIITSVPDIIYRLDNTGRITFVNNAVRQYGHVPEELIGKDFIELVHLDDREKAKFRVKDRRTGDRRTRTFEVRLNTARSSHNAAGRNGRAARVFLLDAEGLYLSDSHSRNTFIGTQGIARDITERKDSEDEVHRALAEKEILLREIHHRVKNNMQVISSLLALQVDRIKDESYAELFRESINRIRTMSLIHETLYQSHEMTRIDFPDYVGKICNHLLTLYTGSSQQVTLDLDIENVVFSINTAIPCGLIINELVSNSLKHGFPDGRNGSISVALHPLEDGRMELKMSHDGVGIPPDMDWRNTDSLGLKLVRILAEGQLDGAIELRRPENAEFVITFMPDPLESSSQPDADSLTEIK